MSRWTLTVSKTLTGTSIKKMPSTKANCVFTKWRSKHHNTSSTLSLVKTTHVLKSAQCLSLSLQSWNLLVNVEVSQSPRARFWGHLVLYFTMFFVWLWTNWSQTTCVIRRQSSPLEGRTGAGLQEHSTTVPVASAWRHGPCWTHQCSGQESQKSWEGENKSFWSIMWCFSIY